MECAGEAAAELSRQAIRLATGADARFRLLFSLPCRDGLVGAGASMLVSSFDHSGQREEEQRPSCAAPGSSHSSPCVGEAVGAGQGPHIRGMQRGDGLSLCVLDRTTGPGPLPCHPTPRSPGAPDASGPEEVREARRLAPASLPTTGALAAPSQLGFLLAEHPDGALGPGEGPHLRAWWSEGARRDTGTVPMSPAFNYVESGSFPEPGSHSPPPSLLAGATRVPWATAPPPWCTTTTPLRKGAAPQELQPRSPLPQVRPLAAASPIVRDLGLHRQAQAHLIWGSTGETTAAPKLQSPSETIAKGDLTG